MFGKNLARELKHYLRRLWPYLLTLGVISAIACLIFLFDDNPIEMNGPIAGGAFFIMAALAFFVRGLVHAYKSFYDGVKSLNAESSQSLNAFLGVRITAFMIFIVFTGLLLLACVSTFAWESVGKLFSAFPTDWAYFVEFFLYIIIFAATLYIIPIALVVANRFEKHKQLAIAIGTITLLLCFFTITPEVLLLIHDSSTDMLSACVTVITSLVLSIISDIGMYILTRRTLKSVFCNNQNDENRETL
ncbi:MAG: hypothetical protein K2M47_06415 [Clostridiales bacterium]|nr:hypothetical protein [Clostridiales bacterium]